MVNRLALAGIAVIFATGVWLIAAPFVLRYQAAGAPWTDAVQLDVFVGSALAAARARRLPDRAGRPGQRTVRAGRHRSGAGRRTGVESVIREL
jgi:hypothetical protein